METLLKNMDEFLDETCSVCGRRLTKYGNKTLKDGILCRSCAKMSSPWLEEEDFKEKTVEDMKKHLDYRRENYGKLDSFVDSKVVEGVYSLHLDEEKKELYFARHRDIKRENPDIVSFDDVEEISIVEEQYLKEDGVDVMFEVKLKNGQFRRMYFRVNEFPGISGKTEEYEKTCSIANDYLKALIDEIDMEEVL